MDAVHSRLRIGRRFRGPPGAANGGFASGSPVPLERPLGARHDGDATLLLGDDDRLLAEAHPSGAELELPAPDAPTPEEARAAAGRAAYYGDPLFPDCVACGSARAPADGLRVFPGPVSRRSVLPAGTPVLLGEMTARLGARPRIGTECRMEVLAAARTLWVTAARTAGGSG